MEVALAPRDRRINMREKLLQIAFIVGLLVLVPDAYARPRKPAQPRASAVMAHARPAKPVPRAYVKKTSRQPGRSLPTLKMIRMSRYPGPTRAAGAKPLRARPLGSKSKTAVVYASTKNPAVAPQPETEPQAAQPPIHVTHDRKVHLAPGSGDAAPVPADTTGARKATPADFLPAETLPTTSLVNFPARTMANASVQAAPAIVAAARLPTPTVVPRVPTIVRRSAMKVQMPVVEEMVLTPVIVPAIYMRRGRLVMPPAMKGSHEILLHQNEMADRDGLDRVQDDVDLDEMRSGKLLVAIPSNAGLQTDERLPLNRRYCRPWTAAFLTGLARAHYARFHTPLQVNSAVRTVEFQQRLLRTNGNAAPAEGETASPHLTGQAVDLAKHGLSMTEIAWLRAYLLPLVEEGKVDVEEEFQQACFHISVYRKYVPTAPARRVSAPHHSAVMTLAAALR